MTKQQEKTIELLKQEIAYLEERNKQLKDAVNHLQPIVNKCFLNSSDYRKRFLTVGSEWECVITCHSSTFLYVVGDLFTISKIEEDVVYPIDDYDYDYVFTDQFLLCFKPR